MDCSPPGSSIHGILQARIMEWVAIPFSRGSFQVRDWSRLSCPAGRFFTIWAIREAPYLQNRITDIENEFMVAQGVDGSLGVWDKHIHTAMSIFKMDNQQGCTVQHKEVFFMLCGSLDGRGVWGRVDTCICMVESLCCPPETITILWLAIPQFKKSAALLIIRLAKLCFSLPRPLFISLKHNSKS